MSARSRGKDRQALDQFFRSVYDSLAKKVLEEDSESAPVERQTARKARPATDAAKTAKPDASKESGEPTIH